MIVNEYEARFIELSCHDSFLIPTEVEKVRQFIDGLTYGIRIVIAQNSDIWTTFHQAVETALRIEHIHSQGRKAMMRDKRPHCSSSFSDTSSGSRD